MPAKVSPFEEIPTSPAYVLIGDEARYPNANDAQMRLSNGFVRFKDEVVWLMEVDGGYLHAMTYDSKFHGHIHMNDSRIDISSPPLGWVNTRDYGPLYARRNPARQQKQSFGFELGYFDAPFAWESKTIRLNHEAGPNVLTVGRTIDGVFPSLQECIGLPRGGAFSRDWAIAREKKGRGTLLLHNNLGVGYFYPEHKKFVFLPNELTKTRMKGITEQIQKSGGNYAVEEYASV